MFFDGLGPNFDDFGALWAGLKFDDFAIQVCSRNESRKKIGGEGGSGAINLVRQHCSRQHVETALQQTECRMQGCRKGS